MFIFPAKIRITVLTYNFYSRTCVADFSYFRTHARIKFSLLYHRVKFLSFILTFHFRPRTEFLFLPAQILFLYRRKNFVLTRNSYLYTSITIKRGKMCYCYHKVTGSLFPLCYKNILNETYVNNGNTDFEGRKKKGREMYLRFPRLSFVNALE